MTNIEAIKFGKEQLEIFGEDSQMSEFIRLALETLEERPKGDWEYNPEWDEYTCPFCLAGFPKEYNFCPNCDAYMRGDT